MKSPRWRNLLASAFAAAGLALSAPIAPAADPVATSEGRVVIIRAAGKPDQHCIVLKSSRQADGTTMHQVRNLETGEVFQVADPRQNRPSSYAPITPMPPAKRLPTTAELAGNPAGTLTNRMKAIQKIGFSRTKKPATPPAALKQPPATAQPATAQPPVPLQAQLANLKEAIAPSQRELAAMALTLGEHHQKPEVVDAIMTACRTDPAATVRATCIRCLFRLAPEAPQVIPVIEDRRSDKNVEVQKLAKLALEELSRRDAGKERR